MMNFPGSVKVADLDKRHGTYARYVRIWDELSWMYQSGDAIQQHAGELLAKRIKEPEAMFRCRVEAVSDTSIIGQGIGWYEGAMFKDAPQIRRIVNGDVQTDGPAQERFTEFIENCDRGGSSYEQVWRQVLVDAILYGRAYVLQDLPKRDETIQTRADELQKMRPFLVRYDPRSVINWGEDGNGNLLWVVIRFSSDEEQPDVFPPKRQRADNWLYYDRTNFAHYRRFQDDGQEKTVADATLVDAGEHALAGEGIVPLYRVQLSDGHWLGHRCYLSAKKHFNLSNALDWGLFNTAIAILVIYGELEQNTASELAYLQLRPGSTASYLEQSGASFAALQSRIEELKSDVFRQMYLLAQARSTSATPAAQSGISKEADMTSSYEVAQAIGQTLLAGMRAVLSNIMKLMGDSAEIEITAFDFEDSDVSLELETISDIRSMGIPSETLDRELSKRAVRKGLPDLDKRVIEQIEQEIEASPTKQELEQQQQEQRLKRIVQAGVPAMMQQ